MVTAMPRTDIDESLRNPRKVTLSRPDAQFGFGYEVTLECGHECWCSVEPGETLYCPDCLERMLSQVRGFQKELIREDV